MALRKLRVVWLACAIALSACSGPSSGEPTSPAAPTAPATPTPPTPPQPVTSSTPVLRLAGADSKTGAELAIMSYDRLLMEFDVAWPEAIPDARLLVDWLDRSGTRCTFTYTDPQRLDAQVVTRITVSKGLTTSGWDCPLPHSTTVVRTTLLRHVPIAAGRIEAITFLTTEHSVEFKFREYPPPPSNAAPVAPAIERMQWSSNVAGCNTACFPLDDEMLTIYCKSSAGDGDALTSSITIKWSDGVVRSGSKSFPAGASSGPLGVEYRFSAISIGAPSMSATCTVTNTRGQSVTQSITGPG